MRFDAAYLSYVLLGAGLLLPWNAFITAADYYGERYPGKHVDRLITVCYLPVNLCTLAALIHFHERLSSRWRIRAGFWAFTLAMGAMPFLNMVEHGSGTLTLLLLLVVTCGVADGVAQGAMFGETACMPPQYTQALVQGTALSGVMVSALRILTKAALPATAQGLQISANLYFLVAAAACACCIAIYATLLPRLKAALAEQPVLQPVPMASLERPAELEDPPAVGAVPGSVSQLGSGLPNESLQLLGNGANGSSLDGLLGGHDKEGESQPPPLSYWQVLWQVREFAGALILLYTITLSIFPGVLSEDLASQRLGSWYPTILIALFNLADWAGKCVPSLPGVKLLSGAALVAASLSRGLFIPAFHFAATRGAGGVVVGVLTVLLGLSNGLLTSLAMMAAPSKVAPEATALCGNLMVLALIFGLCIGASCGFLWLL